MDVNLFQAFVSLAMVQVQYGDGDSEPSLDLQFLVSFVHHLVNRVVATVMNMDLIGLCKANVYLYTNTSR